LRTQHAYKERSNRKTRFAPRDWTLFDLPLEANLARQETADRPDIRLVELSSFGDSCAMVDASPTAPSLALN